MFDDLVVNTLITFPPYEKVTEHDAWAAEFVSQEISEVAGWAWHEMSEKAFAHTRAFPGERLDWYTSLFKKQLRSSLARLNDRVPLGGAVERLATKVVFASDMNRLTLEHGRDIGAFRSLLFIKVALG